MSKIWGCLKKISFASPWSPFKDTLQTHGYGCLPASELRWFMRCSHWKGGREASEVHLIGGSSWDVTDSAVRAFRVLRALAGASVPSGHGRIRSYCDWGEAAEMCLTECAVHAFQGSCALAWCIQSGVSLTAVPVRTVSQKEALSPPPAPSNPWTALCLSIVVRSGHFM